MKKIIALFVLYTNILYLSIDAQVVHSPLKIGEQVPDVSYQHILNYPSAQLKLSDFKGKLLILDFWGVHCSTCIKEMPEMQAYQEKFKDQLQILLVTTDSKTQIQELKKNSAFFSKIDLPIIYNDSTLTQLFPWTAYGLHVWIDRNGKVRYRTNGGSYTETDISNFLAGYMPSLASRDDTTKFNSNIPIWLEGNGRQLKHIKYYSYITDALPDYAGGDGTLIIDSITNLPVGVKFINAAVLNLYITAYNEWGNNTFDSIKYEIKDSTKYFFPDKGDVYKWFRENTVSYELRVPSTKSTELFAVMRQDLERYFDLKGEIDTIQKPLYVLSIDTFLYEQHKKRLAEKNQMTSNIKTITFKELLAALSKLKNANVIINSNANFPYEVQMPPFLYEEDLILFLSSIGLNLNKQFHTFKMLKIEQCD